jgi:Trk K+ transport system NAD-binding subunit
MHALLARLRDRPGIAVIDAFDSAIEHHDVRVGRVRWTGRPIRSLPHIPGALVGLVTREGESFVPGGADVLHEGDAVSIVGVASSAAEAAARLGARPVSRRVRILGAGPAGLALAARLNVAPDDVGLVEGDADTARLAARALPTVPVWLGTAQALRVEAGLDGAVLVEARDAVPEPPKADPQRKMPWAAGFHLWEVDVRAEAACGRPIRSLELPRGALVVGRWRSGRTDVPRGRESLVRGDRVLVVCARGAADRLLRTLQGGS